MLHTTPIYALRISVVFLFLQCLSVLTYAQNQAGLLSITAVNGVSSAKASQIIRLNVTVKNTGTTPSKPDSVYVGQIFSQPYISYLEVITKQVAIAAMNAGETRTFVLDFAIKSPFLEGATNPTITYIYRQSNTFVGIKSNILPPNSAFTSLEYLKGFDYPITPILPKTNIDIQLTASPNFKITIKNNGSEVAKNLYINLPCTGPYACPNPNVSKGNGQYLPPIDSRITPPFRTDRYWYLPDLAVGESATAEVVITDGFFENSNSFLATIIVNSVEFENTGTKTATLTLNNTKGKADLIITEVKAGTPTPNMGSVGKEYLIKPTITIKNIGTEPVNITDNNTINGYIKVSPSTQDGDYSVLDNRGTSFALPKQIPVGGSVTVTTDAFPVYDIFCNQKLYLNTKIYTGRITELRYDNNTLNGVPFTCPLTAPTPTTNAVIGTMTAEPATCKQWSYNKITVNIENTTDAAIPNALVSFNFPPADIAIATDADKKPVATIGTVLSFGPWDIGTLPARSKHSLVFYVFVKSADKPIEITTTFHNKLTLAYYTVAGANITLQPIGAVTPTPTPTPTGNIALTMTAEPTTYAQWGYNKISLTVENKTGADIPNAQVAIYSDVYTDMSVASEPTKQAVTSIGSSKDLGSVWKMGIFPANSKHTWTFYTFAKVGGKPLNIYADFYKDKGIIPKITTLTLQPAGTATPPPTPSGTKPDLSIDNFTLVSPISIPQGELGYFTFDLKNTGTPAYGDYNIGVYIYAYPARDKAILVGNIPTGNTPTGTIKTVKGDFTTIIDDNIAPGNYTLLLKLDNKNVVDEAIELNNEATLSIYISPRLVITNVMSNTKTVKKGEPTTFILTIKNNQNEPSRAATVSIKQIMSSGGFGGNCTTEYVTDYIALTNDIAIPTLAPKETRTISLSFIVNQDIVVAQKSTTTSPGYGYYTNKSEPFFIFKHDALPYQQGTPKCGDIQLLRGASAYGYEYMLRTENSTVTPVATNDLSITMTTTTAQYTQYKNQTLQVTVKNNGTQSINGAKVAFDYLVSALPFTSAKASLGAYNQIDKIWDIGTLNANQTVTLDLVLFPIVKDQDLPVKATLVPTDSNPTNNIATVILKPIGITARSPQDIMPTQATPIIVRSLYPNPTENDVFFNIESLDTREMTFEIRDFFGKMIQKEAATMTKGENKVLLHVENLPQGLYLVTPMTNNMRLTPLKLMKL